MDDRILNMAEVREGSCNYRGSFTLSTDQTTFPDATNDSNFPDTYLHDQVKIIPGKIIFKDAFDGKQFERTFTIINCGKYPAFIRIMPPSSQAFKMRPLKKGKCIPSGLSVTRTIKYVHTSVMALKQACLIIYVNEIPITYQIEVHLISTFVTLTPKSLNFGQLDVGNASKQLSIELRNLGNRVAQFIIDLGRDDLELIVEPMKGTILPKETIYVTVEVLGSKVGCFQKEFWVKTEPPRRVTLTGIFIVPRMTIEYPRTGFNVTLVDFPRTYYGAESVRTVVITNTSSTDRMFCLVVERGKEFEHLENAKKAHDLLKCFSINAVEGRLMARQNFILRFTFSPCKLIKGQKFCQAFLKIMEVNYRDGIVAGAQENVKTFLSSTSVEEYLATPMTENVQDFDDIKIPQFSFVRICLYGEMEEPCVKLHPEDFILSYLNIDETYHRVVTIKNASQHLPVIFKSNIVACVKITPCKGLLRPGQFLEVTISITPSEEGTRTYKVVFDLVYNECQKEFQVGRAVLPVTLSATKVYKKVEPKFNMGITPKVTNEVGFLVEDVRFNSKIPKPRQAVVDENYKSFEDGNSDLIAFPNDMPKCLRPWKSTVPCCTIFAKLPRVVTNRDRYMLTSEEMEKKNQNSSYYANYIKRKADVRRKKLCEMEIIPFEDYEVTDSRHLLMKQLEDSKTAMYKPIIEYGFIPLPPSKLFDVDIKPKYVYLGKIAPYTICTDSFSIENRNEFSIHVSIKALSNSVVIKEKSRIVIAPRKTKDIFFDCYSHGYGKFYVPVYILINDSHVFDATVFASVVPTTVTCNLKEIIINPKTHKSFFELFNPVNCDIHFAWEIQDRNFGVTPESGVIPSRKRVFCSVSFIPQIDATYKTEMYLLSQSGAKQIVPVHCANDRATIGFSVDVVKFDNIPMNISVSRCVVLRNFSDEEIMYLVTNPNPLEEITVSPAVGKLKAKSDVDIVVTALFTKVTTFNCTVMFTMQDVYDYEITVSGNVVLPYITIVPNNIQICKVPCGSYQRYNMKIKNTSAAKNVVKFCLEDIQAFAVTDTAHKALTGSITLEPDETKDLILEFKPEEPVAYSLYFPYKMNDIIGPPLLNDPSSLRTERYIRSDPNHKTTSDIPKTIKTLCIRCAASTPWLEFSSLNLVFEYEGKKCRKRFTITNVSNTNHRLTFPFIEPKHHFVMKLENKTGLEPSDKSWKFVVTPGETASFKVDYTPSGYGKSAVELPFYVESYIHGSPFNYLKLSGTYSMPLISTKHSLLYFQSIMVKEKITKKVNLELSHHRRDCVVETTVLHPALCIKALKRSEPIRPSCVQYDSIAEYLIKFDPKEECIVHSPVTFNCTCGITYDVTVKASADNCIFCSYQSNIKARALAETGTFESSFPYYPKENDNSYYATTVKVIKEDVERWLCSQGFFYMSFYKIPYGMARFPVNIQPRTEGESKAASSAPAYDRKQQSLPLVQLLVNLIDPTVVKYFYDKGSKPYFEGVEGVTYACSIYKNVLVFLEAQGVFVAQLKPEHLLPYDGYRLFKENLNIGESAGEQVFSQTDFLYFTKQAWLDLILRIYKVFVYNRATNTLAKSKSHKTLKPLVYEEEIQVYRERHDNNFHEDVIESEAKLLLWLEFHFHKQRFVLWDENTNKKLANRKFRSFEQDLTDTVPFATLMVAYCPYMIKLFHNFFPLGQNEEDVYHNACIIYETWKRLHLSYDLRPARLVKPSTTEMDLLVTYLYDVLPSFYPTETITFKAPLGETSTNRITLKNKGDAVIGYTTLFFLNNEDAFGVNTNVVKIVPGSTGRLQVTYKAKSSLKKTAVLVLSGETIGFKFAKTMAFNLVGIPDIFQFTEEFTRKVEVFKKVNATWDLDSPFESAYEAELYLFLGDQTQTPETLDEFVSVGTLISEKVPVQMLLNPVCSFDKDGSARIVLRLCYVACGEYTYFLYFHNKEVGDFCAKVSISAVMSEKCSVDLNVDLPRQFSTEQCTCSHRTMDLRCPRLLYVDVPSKNHTLIDGLVAMFANCADKDQFDFWQPLLDYPKGFHVLREYLANTFEDNIVPFKCLMNLKVNYSVRLRNTKKMTTAKSITIADVTCSEAYRLQMHWNDNEFPKHEKLFLTADHQQEKRIYNLMFVKARDGCQKLSTSSK